MKLRMVNLTLAALVTGLALGVGGYTFVYAKGYSYLVNDPAACANCHIMRDQFDGWVKSSHRKAATCNDCHTPPGLIPKYATKAENGFRHSFAFTTGRYPDAIHITPHDRTVTERACRKCHTDIVGMIDGPHAKAKDLSCLRCHGSVGHP
ncbi:MAG: cytochrome c nitrite reductase small subunit [Verrucomicrobia bacterium]|nr:cytochrome c nitrite reductase small subunit [Verrucomicrobiota bacterium]